jgi:crossover junction endodeoxyribonuclease RusA
MNTYWRQDRRYGRTYISHQGMEFRKNVIALVRLLRVRPLAGPLRVLLVAHPPDHRRRDIDNIQKPTLDALQHAGVYGDDSQIVDLRSIKGSVIRGGRLLADISICSEVMADARLLDAAIR